MNEKPAPWVKVSIIVGSVLLLIFLLLIVKMQRDIINKQSQLETSLVEMKQLGDGIVRSQASYVSRRDLEEFAKNSNVNLEPIEEDLKKLGAEVKGISSILVASPGYTGSNLS